MKFSYIRSILRISLLLLVLTASRMAAETAHLSIDASKAGAKIDRNLFGQFAENLGHGLYEGIWVGPDSPIPNTRGIRKDVVTALRALKVPNVRWPGGCFADRVPLAQRNRPSRAAAGDAQLRMGRRGRHKQLRHRRIHGFHPADRQPGLRLGQRRKRNSAGSGRVAGVHDRRAAHGAGQRSAPPTVIPTPTRSASWASATRAGPAAAT